MNKSSTNFYFFSTYTHPFIIKNNINLIKYIKTYYYYPVHNFYKLLLLFLLISFNLTAQVFDNNLSLAREYFSQADYAKANIYYQKVWEKNVTARESIVEEYVFCLEKENKQETAEKIIKKLQKNAANADKIQVYLLFKYASWNNLPKHDKLLSQIIKNATDDEKMLSYFVLYQNWNDVIYFINQKRNAQNNAVLYIEIMCVAFKNTNQQNAYLNELFTLLQYMPSNQTLETIKTIFINNIKNETEFDKLAQVLLKNIQQYPDNDFLVDLYSWVFVQKKDFRRAFIQLKALEIRKKTGGEKLKELSTLAIKNDAFEEAIEILQFLVLTYPNSENKLALIKAKDAQFKAKLPVDISLLTSLVSDYQILIAQTNQLSFKNDLKRELALLHAYYENDFIKAENLLQEIISSVKNNNQQLARAKIDLADVYLFKGDNWQSSILYSQAEKLVKDTPLAYEAKLKNAKLFYYNSEFLLAQEQLNVLKNATTREISNDAIQMSVFIQDQLQEDSASPALIKYAQAELNIFKNKFDLAEKQLDTILTRFPQDPIRDDVYWQKATLAYKLSNYNKALEFYTITYKNFTEDIYADDALYQMAYIYQFKLNNLEKAKELYQEFMLKFPSSIYVEEARKQFRLLRGDVLN